MRWAITITGSERDIQRVVDAFPDLSAGDSVKEAVLRFEDEWDELTDDSLEVVRQRGEAAVRHLNAVGKLRFGRTFEGVSIDRYKHDGGTGPPGSRVFLKSVSGHLTPGEFTRFVAMIGHPPQDPPFGLPDIEGLDLASVAELADADADVARVLQLVELMLVGDEDIDWSAAYSALEAIDTDARGCPVARRT